MNIIEEIRSHFAALYDGMRKLESVPEEYPAYSLRYQGEYGVAFDYDSDKDILEESVNAKISTREVTIWNGERRKCLLLTCYDEEFRNEFAYMCELFITPGVNGEARKKIIENPLVWWNKWIELLGDHKGKKVCYDELAELITLDFLYKDDSSVIWTAAEAGTHDIESASASYEVKSTIKKSETHVIISSRHQLEAANKLELFFFRMEKSLSGFSINDVADSLEKHGYDRSQLEKQLADKGYSRGMSIRDTKFTILEVRRYIVGEKFPKIVEGSFKNGVFPHNIIKIIYTIDLEGIDYTSLNFIKNENHTISAINVVDINNTSVSKYNQDIDKNESIENNIFSEYEMGCIPLYSLRAACGAFIEGETPEEEGWVDATGHGFTPDPKRFFVVRANGNSMEPRIKDGSFCVFEKYYGGSREGEIVLTEIKGTDPDYDCAFTIKKYHSEKIKTEEGWEHSTIILKSLNSDCPNIELEEGERYSTFGILKCVLS